MKKYTIYFLLLLCFSCKRETDPAFDRTPDERLNEALAKYQSTLTGSANGWNATLVTAIGITFSFYFRFNDSNRVFMYSDFDSTSSSTVKESSYRLKALQQPSLLFDTYSYIHVLADPDANKNGGYFGGGLISDFEFSLDSVSDERIVLTGRFNGSKAIFTKATAQDRQAWETKQVWRARQSFGELDRILNYFKRLTYGSTQYELRFDPLYKKVTITWLDAQGVAQTAVAGYYFGPGGIMLTSPIVNGSDVISSFSIESFNASTSTLSVKVSGNGATITGAIAPIKPDLNAGQRWWQFAVNRQTYWVSPQGFHVNGVNDAFNLSSLYTDSSEYYYLVYWPGIQPASGQGFDVMMPFYYLYDYNALDYFYGTAHRPTFRSDGKVAFTYLGDLTFGPHPQSGPAQLTRQKLYSTTYWFVQTGDVSFDMVSANDAKAWVSWRMP